MRPKRSDTHLPSLVAVLCGVLGAAPLAAVGEEVRLSPVARVQLRGEPVEIAVRDGAALRTGDELQIRVVTARDAYVYVVAYGSSGKALLLHPFSADVADAFVPAGEHALPDPNIYLPLDSQEGREVLVAFASATPEDGVAKLLARMESHGGDVEAVVREVRRTYPEAQALVFRHIGSALPRGEPADASAPADAPAGPTAPPDMAALLNALAPGPDAPSGVPARSGVLSAAGSRIAALTAGRELERAEVPPSPPPSPPPEASASPGVDEVTARSFGVKERPATAPSLRRQSVEPPTGPAAEAPAPPEHGLQARDDRVGIESGGLRRAPGPTLVAPDAGQAAGSPAMGEPAAGPAPGEDDVRPSVAQTPGRIAGVATGVDDLPPTRITAANADDPSAGLLARLFEGGRATGAGRSGATGAGSTDASASARPGAGDSAERIRLAQQAAATAVSSGTGPVPGARAGLSVPGPRPSSEQARRAAERPDRDEALRDGPLEAEVVGAVEPGASVVLVIGPDGSGSGLVIDRRGHVLTRWRLVRGAARVTVVLGQHTTGTSTPARRLPARVVRLSRFSDLALIAIEAPPADLVPLLLAQSATPVQGSRVRVLGRRAGGGLALAQGRLVEVKSGGSWYSGRGLLHRASVAKAEIDGDPGTAGGAMLDEQNQVIGLTVQGRRGGGQVSAVAVDSIRAFLGAESPAPSLATAQ
jgi:hypothetical protein